LLKRIEEFQKHVAITGFRGVKVKNVDQFLEETNSQEPKNVEIQLFDANLVATWQHLYFAALNALTAFRNKENISRSLSMETMLYASAQHQIRKAMEIIGIKPSTKAVAVLIVGEKPVTVETVLAKTAKRIGGKEDEEVLGLTEEKMLKIRAAFGISDAELRTSSRKSGSEQALIDLVVERMALLSTER
jgi:tRNA threonylcarbamoyladenosine modification (KEOPS) complex Cgi121 subunit